MYSHTTKTNCKLQNKTNCRFWSWLVIISNSAARRAIGRIREIPTLELHKLNLGTEVLWLAVNEVIWYQPWLQLVTSLVSKITGRSKTIRSLFKTTIRSLFNAIQLAVMLPFFTHAYWKWPPKWSYSPRVEHLVKIWICEKHHVQFWTSPCEEIKGGKKIMLFGDFLVGYFTTLYHCTRNLFCSWKHLKMNCMWL